MLHKISRPLAVWSFLLRVMSLPSARKEFDVAEIEQQLATPLLVHQAEQLLADDLDILLVENLAVDEVDDGDVADLLHL